MEVILPLEKRWEKFGAFLNKTGDVRLALASANITKKEYDAILKQYPAAAEWVEAEVMKFEEQLLDVIVSDAKAKDGKTSVESAKWLLEKINPARYGKQNGTQINVQIGDNIIADTFNRLESGAYFKRA